MFSRTYTLEELVTRPDTVDPSRLETYLSPKDFMQLFGMTLEEFSQLSSWKKDDIKRSVGLF
jgi:hypothetical protein